MLLIVVDDLRPELSAFTGKTELSAFTPNIDKLAQRATVFTRAYAQQAVCGASRNSFMSGRRPRRTQVWNFINNFRQAGPNWLSLPQYFKVHGFTTLGAGKTFHMGSPPSFDQPFSWSQERPYVFSNGNGTFASGCPGCPFAYPVCERSDSQPRTMVCPTAAPVASFSDHANMRGAVEHMKFAGRRGTPWFIAYGANRPHLPWNMPQQYWDRTEHVSLPKHEAGPAGMPDLAFPHECDGSGTLSAFNQTLPVPSADAATAPPPNFTRSLRRGYAASVAFVDAMVGDLLAGLDAIGATNDTVIALVSDHGYQLGEHNIWGKHTNFELGTRVPLLVHRPGIPASRTDALVEAVDLYPTLAALAGLPAPADVDGADLSPLMRGEASALKPAAFSEYPRCLGNRSAVAPAELARVRVGWGSAGHECGVVDRSNFTAMGYSVRVPEWRYTVWLAWDGERLRGDFSATPLGVELYAHSEAEPLVDFDAHENVNLAWSPMHAATAKRLFAMARAHWDPP